MKAFVFDSTICHGCYQCQLACKDEHCGNDWTPYAKPQPETGHFWGKLNEYVRGTVPKVKMSYVFVPCQHCKNAPCIDVCSIGAIYAREDGLIIINPKTCTGCQKCIDICSYKAVYYNSNLDIAQKCTGCSHLIDRGWKEPRCSDACPTLALKHGEESDLRDLINRAETLYPEYGLTTRVHYIGLPKKFIAGTVYDSVTKEVVIGATCTLSGDSTATVVTDSYGDFWFNDLEVGTFSLKIEASGYPAKEINSIKTEKDVNLGDISLT